MRRTRSLAGAALVALALATAFVGVAKAAPPDGIVTVPVANQVFPAGTVTLQGSATDDVGVLRAQVAIRNTTTGRWRQASGTWSTGFAWLTATLASPGATASSWSFAFTAPTGSFTMGLRITDTGNAVDPAIPWVPFRVTATPVDSAPPGTAVTFPAAGQVVPTGAIVVTGTATDDVRVASLQVALRNRVTGRWLRADGTWATTMAWLPGPVLAAPGTPSTTWTWTTDLAAASYTVGARARDASNKVDPSPAWVTFEVQGTTPTTRPNIVLILTDDQRFDTLDDMPLTRSLIGDAGTTFQNAFVVNALCCPSRATIAQGAYSHTTGVYQNTGEYGPMQAYDDTSTIATWLDAAGYSTALMGKYFNGYDESRGSYVPPGWDRWAAFATTDVGGGRYYDYSLSVDGTLEYHGWDPDDYSTDVLADAATSFINGADPDDPLFLWFSPYGPHEPAIAAPRHTNDHATTPPWRPTSYNEADVSDKPAYIRAIPPFTSTVSSRIDTLRRRQLDTLLSVDEAVEDIVTALDQTGRLENTMIVFLSDNGFLWGEHRWGYDGPNQKQVPYEESIRTPMLLRYDPLTAGPGGGGVETRMALTIDLAPTFAALAGVAAPGSEGRSLLPLLDGSATSWRDDFLVEHHITVFPSYCAVRTTTELYVRYGTGEQEYYDMATDPWQLTNRAGDPAVAARVAALRARATQLCAPPPPGFSWGAG